MSPADPVPPGDSALPPVTVFDIDGVLADVRHRLHHVTRAPKDWRAFFDSAPQDPGLPDGIGAVHEAAQAGHAVMYLTGRPERCRSATLTWLADQGLPEGPLHMRGDADRRPARITKVATLRRVSRRYRIEAFVDDDAAVVAAVRAAGFPVLHARWMGSETQGADCAVPAPDAALDDSGRTATDVLFEIQETEGRS